MATRRAPNHPSICQLGFGSLGRQPWAAFFGNASTHTSSKSHNDNLRHLVDPIGAIQWLQARSGLGITQAQQLRLLFDNQTYAPAARLLLIFNALVSPLTRPERLIEALSFADNETAFVYAHVLARFHLPSMSNWQYLSDYLSQKIDTILVAHPKMLTMSSETSGANTRSTTDARAHILSMVNVAGLQQFAYLTQHKAPLIRAQAVAVLGKLSRLLSQQSYEDDAKVFAALQEWQRSIESIEILLQRHHYPADTDELSQQGMSNADIDDTYQTLAFGVWLGVIRENDHSNSSTEQAIRGLMWLTKPKPTLAPSTDTALAASNQGEAIDWSDSVSRALLPLLHRPRIETRELVWDCLSTLPISASKLAECAMNTPYRDMVKRGLHCLINSLETASVSSDSKVDVEAASNQPLTDLLFTNHDLLAEETYQLLKERMGHLPTSLMALNTESLPLLRQVVSEWRHITTRTSQTAGGSDQAQALRQDKLTFYYKHVTVTTGRHAIRPLCSLSSLMAYCLRIQGLIILS